MLGALRNVASSRASAERNPLEYPEQKADLERSFRVLRAYDATQHLFNCVKRMLLAPDATIRRFADLLEGDNERVRLWVFARATAEPRETWNEDSINLANALS